MNQHTLVYSYRKESSKGQALQLLPESEDLIPVQVSPPCCTTYVSLLPTAVRQVGKYLWVQLWSYSVI